MTNSIDWIVFDLGGVIVDLDLSYTIRTLSEKAGVDPSVLEPYLSGKMGAGDRSITFGEQLQLGQINEEDFIGKVHAHLNQAVTKQDIKDAIQGVLLRENQETLDVIKAIAPHYKLACFSNTHEIHWEYLTRRYECFSYFKELVASHIINLAKPDPASYQEMTRLLDADPARSIFIDDSKVNVDAAIACGWKGIVFEDAESLRRHLGHFGVQPWGK